jgi:hypothetical protein
VGISAKEQVRRWGLEDGKLLRGNFTNRILAEGGQGTQRSLVGDKG